ncbi:hypothetical protein CP556_13670 [Natrinema sp. CBA1119]|uniref:hypothetical protein n=1 Tax=Natrinema sp. CBA1119 TaxID=1608465 RepID=UPI000BF8B7E2|nr:hypothetical protein [Natrinema sp. CBA1119]PGF17062.1 hypothetical protein CP556_13670 [Natrinema sp. CBA1119]
MSDERSPSTAATDDPGAVDDVEADDGSSEALEPSGGPRRVVSEQSVDDILDSLDATKAESTDSSDEPTTTNEPSDTVTTAADESDVPTADEEVDATTNGMAADEPTTDDIASRSGEGADASDPASVDAAASSLPDDASLEDLATRVDDGTVTGADVRAAEAGDGRESTPEIDDVDLSMNDLETTETEASDSGGDIDVPDDAGPLAGSVDRDANSGASDESADDEPGLFGRLKQFFSR